MKFFIKRVLYFILYLPIVYIIFLFVSIPILPKHLQRNIHYVRFNGDYLYTKTAEADTVKKLDILVLGASGAYRSFDPRIFKKNGMRMLTLGSSSQTPVQTQYLVNKYINKIKTKMVIYNVDYIMFGIDPLESSLDFFSNAHHFDRQLLSMAFEQKSIVGFNTFTYAWLNSLWKNDKKEPASIGLDTYISDGFVERKISKHQYSGEHLKKISVNVDPKQFQIFLDICKNISNKGIKIIIVQTPTSIDTYRSIKNKDSIQQLFSSFKSAPYLNFNDTTVFKNNLFFDKTHLNQQGVEIFDDILIKKIGNISY